MSHMDRNNSRPNQHRVSGSLKTSYNYFNDSFRSSGALNSSFGISGTAQAAAQHDAVIRAERERIRLVKEQQARNEQRQASVERTFSDLQHVSLVERIRQKQAQENAAKKKAIRDLYWHSSSVGSVGMKTTRPAGADEDEEEEYLRKAMRASYHSPGLRPFVSSSSTSSDDDDDDGDYTETNEEGVVVIDHTDARKVLRSEGQDDDDDEGGEEEEEGNDEDVDDISEGEETEMRKELMYSIYSSSPHRPLSSSLSSSSPLPSLRRILSENCVLSDCSDTASDDQSSEELHNILVSSLRGVVGVRKINDDDDDDNTLVSRNILRKERLEVDYEKKSEEEMEKAKQQQALFDAMKEARKVYSSSVKSEPYEAEGGVQVIIRMPNGSRFSRRFRLIDTIRDLKNFIESKAEESGLGFEYEITSDFPKRTFHDQPPYTRLEASGLLSRTLLHIKEI
eukprot:TRINITY_DN1044_c2_g1_i1.p1 TRINITY_DN1044_c2_g1~~TRINITY_DN1044_c2_g1_i1.p1  ORF type:complete len:452 (-),score=156.41 TRINITY_DN1044_c2_g1_i1:152-1507(-)